MIEKDNVMQKKELKERKKKRKKERKNKIARISCKAMCYRPVNMFCNGR